MIIIVKFKKNDWKVENIKLQWNIYKWIESRNQITHKELIYR